MLPNAGRVAALEDTRMLAEAQGHVGTQELQVQCPSLVYQIRAL